MKRGLGETSTAGSIVLLSCGRPVSRPSVIHSCWRAAGVRDVDGMATHGL